MKVVKMPHARSGLPGLYLAIFLLSLTGLFAKSIPLDAVSIIQLRGVFAVIGLVLFALVRKQNFWLSSVRSYAGIYALGMLLGIHWVTFFHAMQISSVAVGMLSLFSYPMITILLEPFFTKQKIKTGDIFAGLIMFVGLTIMLAQGLNNPQGSITQGVLWGVFSALLFSLRNLIQKYHFQDVASESLMFHQVVAVAAMLAVFVDGSTVRVLTASDVFIIILLGIFSTAIAHTLLVFSLKQLPAKSVSLISCLQPVIATFLAWYFIKEIPEMSVLIGGGLVLSVAAYESVQKRPSC